MLCYAPSHTLFTDLATWLGDYGLSWLAGWLACLVMLLLTHSVILKIVYSISSIFSLLTLTIICMWIRPNTKLYSLESNNTHIRETKWISISISHNTKYYIYLMYHKEKTCTTFHVIL